MSADVFAFERPPAREHLVEHTAKCPESLRLSAARPFACSGAMYAAVPRIIPACVIAGVVMVGDSDTLADVAPVGSIAFASPKSSTFTVPSRGP